MSTKESSPLFAGAQYARYVREGVLDAIMERRFGLKPVAQLDGLEEVSDEIGTSRALLGSGTRLAEREAEHQLES